jgi:hypothetical protein
MVAERVLKTPLLGVLGCCLVSIAVCHALCSILTLFAQDPTVGCAGVLFGEYRRVSRSVLDAYYR